MKTRRFWILLLSMLAVAGCGGDKEPLPPKPHAASPVERVRELSLEASAYFQSITLLLGRPWANLVPNLEQFRGVLGDLQGFMSQASRLRPEDVEPAKELERTGRELLGRLDGAPKTCVKRLEKLLPVADRVHAMATELQGTLEKLGAPDDAPVPLRTRYRDGWLPELQEGFRFVSLGLVELLRSQQGPTRFDIGAAGLERAVASGKVLDASLKSLLLELESVEGRLRRIEGLSRWAERTFTAGRDAASGKKPEASALENMRVAKELALETSKSSRERWVDVRSKLLAEDSSASAEVLRLCEELESAQTQLTEAVAPTARELGIPKPR